MAICIIPARSGSVRIKNKNIIDFFGKPMIAHVINIAKRSKLFDRIIVSTDSKKIAKIALKYGAEVPFLRSKKLSNNFTPTVDVIINSIKKISTENIDFHCCIYPTAILTSINDLKLAYKKIKKLKANCLIAITRYQNPPQRCLEKKNLNYIKYKHKKNISIRSQDLKTYYYDTGSFCFYKTTCLLKKKNSFISKITYIEIDNQRVVDINYHEDLRLAKLKYSLIYKIK
jgi:pseudaminic acid cytidylyltransferase